MYTYVLLFEYFLYFLEALIKYRSINKELPNSIIIYRDGVGDGQLSSVHRTEVDMVKVGIYIKK